MYDFLLVINFHLSSISHISEIQHREVENHPTLVEASQIPIERTPSIPKLTVLTAETLSCFAVKTM